MIEKLKIQRIMLLNGGDMFRPSPSFSLMYLTTPEKRGESYYSAGFSYAHVRG
ncbi:MAG: VOC family protein [Porphyromonadaceae bacterium]|nr:VOC family protein [Porphyromonadaceae bacterium]